VTAPKGLLDTSVFIAREQQRSLLVSALPDEGFVSVITLAELHAGVLAAANTDVRARRLDTLDAVSPLEPLLVTAPAAAHWARLRVRLAEAHRSVNVNDLWISAIALAHDMPVVTQDDDFDVLADLSLVDVIRV